MKNIIILLSILCIFTSLSYAQDITLNATISSATVGAGEQITYSISASGGSGNIPQPKLPALPDFKVYNAGTSSSYQFINGQVSSSVTYNYTLIPIKEGTFTIGASSISYKGKVYQTQPLTVKVARTVQKKQKKKPTTIEERFFKQNQTGELFVRTLVNKNKAYVNEPVLFSYKLYYRNVAISQYGLQKPPDFSGFWVEDIPPSKVRKREVEMYKGKKYYTLTLEKKVLFPTAPGKKYIKGTDFTFLIEDFFSFFGKRVKRSSPSITVTVSSLPSANKPPLYNGTVGHYKMSIKLSTKNIIQNEPFSLRVIISGSGNIKSIAEPKAPEFNNFRIYDTHSSINIQKNAGGISGNKTYEYILIPESAGTLEISPFVFCYFNYVNKKYKTLKTKKLTFKVKPGKKGGKILTTFQSHHSDVTLIGKDICFIKENINTIKNQGDYFFNNFFFWILVILPIIILGGAFYYYKYKSKLESDITFAKASRAFRLAKKHLEQIKINLQKSQMDNIPSLFEKMITGYISDKFNIPISNIVIEQIKKNLIKLQLNKKLITEVEELYKEINILRYSPATADKENYKELLYKSNETINNIEKEVNPNSNKTSYTKLLSFIKKIYKKVYKKIIILILFLIPVIIYANKDNTIELFNQGNEKYKKGQYQDAIKFYESILLKNIKNGYVYFNLGNAYFKANHPGKAILNYERAKIYYPSDKDIKFNLKFANSKKIDRIQEIEYNPFTKIILFIYNIFSVNTLFFLTYLTLLILIASLIFKWFYKNTSGQIINQKIFNYLRIIFILFLFILIIKVHQIKSTEKAIILSSQIKVKSGPSEDYTDIFTLHEGTKVKIRKENDTWTLIILPNGFSGWIKKDNLEKIQGNK